MGMIMGKFESLDGRRFGRLVVISRSANGVCGAVRWNCLCDCGNTTTSFGAGLRAGRTTSCGCKNKERMSIIGSLRETHGRSNTKEYDAFLHMHQRCYSKKSSQYKNYGGRGITVCERWHSFENFIHDIGDAPGKDYSVERVDVMGNYGPENCKWDTWKNQQRNRRNNRIVIVEGDKKTLAEWCELKGIDYSKAWARLFVLGWDAERAFANV